MTTVGTLQDQPFRVEIARINRETYVTQGTVVGKIYAPDAETARSLAFVLNDRADFDVTAVWIEPWGLY